MIYLKNFNLKKLLKTIKLNEENISMVMGAIVIVIVVILVFNYFNGKKGGVLTDSSVSTGTEPAAKIHTVAKGETLWSIAKDNLGSGFNWAQIKEENKLTSDVIEVGQKLTIPETQKITVEKPEVKEITDSYTVIKGDNLWTIAVAAYGDGYKWTEIAKANNLTHPNIIHAGNVLKLP